MMKNRTFAGFEPTTFLAAHSNGTTLNGHRSEILNLISSASVLTEKSPTKNTFAAKAF